MTVPSCALHNNSNSMDVVYSRNVITILQGVNEQGERLFLNKTLKSLDRSPGLLHSTFGTMRPVQLQGMQVGAFDFDLPRIKIVMVACARPVKPAINIL